MTLVSHVPKKNCAVIILPTIHHTKEAYVNNKDKSEINLYWNSTKGGVTTLDQMVHDYSVRYKTNKWPFYSKYYRFGGIASLILWKNLGPNWN